MHQKAFEAVEIEMVRAESQHGPLTTNLDRAFVILSEEHGEVAKAVLELNRGLTNKGHVQAELIQLASVALLIYENLNKKENDR